ncbi:MAG TPA: hypothetical protein VGB88_07220 [Alphaproteobacteria bacterium]
MSRVDQDLAIDVWQFVRLMVELEARARARRAGAAYRAWREAWQELDRRLAELGTSDPAAYAELMMGQQVMLETPSPAELADAISALDAVIAQLAESIARGKVGARRLADLRFERDELAALKTRLARRPAGKAGQRPSRARRSAGRGGGE